MKTFVSTPRRKITGRQTLTSASIRFPKGAKNSPMHLMAFLASADRRESASAATSPTSLLKWPLDSSARGANLASRRASLMASNCSDHAVLAPSRDIKSFTQRSSGFDENGPNSSKLKYWGPLFSSRRLVTRPPEDVDVGEGGIEGGNDCVGSLSTSSCALLCGRDAGVTLPPLPRALRGGPSRLLAFDGPGVRQVLPAVSDAVSGGAVSRTGSGVLELLGCGL
mmetsp:Transcript_11209/g.31036  ORF Transcript_11209/g.31036 Transcript_11209/m.31036 type:complete len:224 (-) Transcript_11209:331-1002(-)